MTAENKDALLAKVDDDKREFLKKLALGSAYAIPAMATLSIDSVRNKALAQGGYIAAAVLGFSFVPGGGLSAAPARGLAAPAVAWFTLTFNRPMNTNKGSIACNSGFCQILTNALPTVSNRPAPPSCTDSAPWAVWQWSGGNTKLSFPVNCDTGPETMEVTLAGFEDADGGPLEGQAAWAADLCSPADWDYFTTACAGGPAVQSLDFVPTSIPVDSARGNDVGPPLVAGWFELTFDKPMNQGKGSISCVPATDACGGRDAAVPPESNLVGPPPACDAGWFWASSTKQRLEVTCGFPLLEEITVTLSGYEGMQGKPLEGQMTWSAKSCPEIYNRCFF